MARILVEAALRNRCVQQLISDPSLPYSETSIRRSPPVRVEFEQAVAIGDIGSCLQATRSKHWGDGPFIVPLLPDDPVDPWRILYLYRSGSIPNRRFEQRMRMKELLGKRYRALVGEAKHFTKELFLAQLRADEAHAIQRLLSTDPGTFWRAAQGKCFLPLPPRERQLALDFAEDELP